ncbi:MAG: SPASM domain-containing protein [Ignavibacteriales bacterium]|nr:SPASM domain-containing protein [Ignavibacteriales bacterium]
MGNQYIFSKYNISLFKKNQRSFDLPSLHETNPLKEIFQQIDSNLEIENQNLDDKELDRLTLNIVNKCNLNCKYCYAKGGSYGNPIDTISYKTLVNAIDLIFHKFNHINKIQYFGGEPLLAPNIISEACEYILDVCTRLNKRVPMFYVVTNGTNLSDSILDIINKYSIKVTVSIDGPTIIHETLRGINTMQKIVEFTSALKENNNRFSIECTYTKLHYDSNILIEDLLEYFFNTFGVREVHIPWVSVDKGSPFFLDEKVLKNVYTRAIKYCFRTIANKSPLTFSFLTRLLRVLITRSPTSYCPAGGGTISISTTGDIYPCFMFIGNNAYSIGNVNSDVQIKDNKYLFVRNQVIDARKSMNKTCKSCWAEPLCFGCIGADYILTGSLTQKTYCSFKRAFAEKFIKELILFVESAH